jgi:hypothetical protein
MINSIGRKRASRRSRPRFEPRLRAGPIGNGGPGWTRTTALTLIRLARLGFATTHKTAGTVKIPASRTRHHNLWVGLWVGNLVSSAYQRPTFAVLSPARIFSQLPTTQESGRVIPVPIGIRLTASSLRTPMLLDFSVARPGMGRRLRSPALRSRA